MSKHQVCYSSQDLKSVDPIPELQGRRPHVGMGQIIFACGLFGVLLPQIGLKGVAVVVIATPVTLASLVLMYMFAYRMKCRKKCKKGSGEICAFAELNRYASNRAFGYFFISEEGILWSWSRGSEETLRVDVKFAELRFARIERSGLASSHIMLEDAQGVWRDFTAVVSPGRIVKRIDEIGEVQRIQSPSSK